MMRTTVAMAGALVVLVSGAVTAASCGAAAGRASVYVSLSGNDANNGHASTPVLTFDRAYRLAKPGQAIEVAAGEYPPQMISLDVSKQSTKPVVIRSAPDATVSVPLLDFGQAQLSLAGPRYVTVRNLHVGLVRAWAGADGIIWENLDARYFGIFGAKNVTLRGGDYGPCEAPREGGCESFIAGGASHIVLDHVYLHDITTADPANYHVDGVFLRGATDVVIRNSRFRGNHVDNLRLQDQACCPNQDVLIENNWFGPSLQGNGVMRADAIDVDTTSPRLVIRNNSFGEGAGVQLRGDQSGAVLAGNLMAIFPCAKGVLYSRNVVMTSPAAPSQGACGSTDKRVSHFNYVDGPGFDYHIAATSPAINAGDSRNCPRNDIDNHPRGRGIKCDAGAVERGVLICHRVSKKSAKLKRYATREIDRARLAAFVKRGDRVGKCAATTTH